MVNQVDLESCRLHVANCRKLAMEIKQAFASVSRGDSHYADPSNFRGTWELISSALPSNLSDELVLRTSLWPAAYAALRREFMAIEPLVIQYGNWIGGVPFERWLDRDGPPVQVYEALVGQISEEEGFNLATAKERTQQAANGMLAGDLDGEFGRMMAKATQAIWSECDEFLRALNGLSRELQRRNNAPPPDGPFGLNQWRCDGVESKSSLSPKPHAIAVYLFQRLNQKVRISDIHSALYDDKPVGDETIAKHGRNASTWFADNGIRFDVRTERGTIWMEKLTTEE